MSKMLTLISLSLTWTLEYSDGNNLKGCVSALTFTDCKRKQEWHFQRFLHPLLNLQQEPASGRHPPPCWNTWALSEHPPPTPDTSVCNPEPTSSPLTNRSSPLSLSWGWGHKTLIWVPSCSLSPVVCNSALTARGLGEELECPTENWGRRLCSLIPAG